MGSYIYIQPDVDEFTTGIEDGDIVISFDDPDYDCKLILSADSAEAMRVHLAMILAILEQQNQTQTSDRR
jgi:hypothetical protein